MDEGGVDRDTEDGDDKDRDESGGDGDKDDGDDGMG